MIGRAFAVLDSFQIAYHRILVRQPGAVSRLTPQGLFFDGICRWRDITLNQFLSLLILSMRQFRSKDS